ncbi:MAG: mannose-6-phosphate isomerase [Bacilli bacterium]|nr:mannose-6-phosphate isomerase [Bacilli bacterium]
MERVLLLSAPLKEVIWGGKYFKDVLKVTNSNEKIGEMWSCSAHKNGQSIIKNGFYEGKTLDFVYKNHKELFNNSTLDEFPILVKLIATSDKLSVQVHPNDEYAKENENQFGKTEGWLILEANEDSSIIVSHNAKDKEELIKYIENDDYDNLLKQVKVKKGEFYPISSGTIHALGKDIVLLEIQQSSDVTYRFYDYHRKDKDGNERPLHVKKAIEVTNFDQYDFNVKNCFTQDIDVLWDNEYFIVKYQEVNEQCILENDSYRIITVIEGSVCVEDNHVSKGESFIVTSNAKEIKLLGNAKIVITNSKI